MRTIALASIVGLACGTALQAQNPHGGPSGKPQTSPGLSLPRRSDTGASRQVGPHFDANGNRPAEEPSAGPASGRGRELDSLRRRANPEAGRQSDDGDSGAQPESASQGQPTTTDGSPTQQPSHPVDPQLRNRLAAIDRMRDQALERGDLETLRHADWMERQLRQESQVPRRPVDQSAGSPPVVQTGATAPSGIDPSAPPPGLLHAAQVRFQGRLEHLDQLPTQAQNAPGQLQAQQSGVFGRLNLQPGATTGSTSTTTSASTTTTAPTTTTTSSTAPTSTTTSAPTTTSTSSTTSTPTTTSAPTTPAPTTPQDPSTTRPAGSTAVPPGIDPSAPPPGLLRAAQARFHGRLEHLDQLPMPAQNAPGQLRAPQSGIFGRLDLQPGTTTTSTTAPTTTTAPASTTTPTQPSAPSPPTSATPTP